MATSSFDSRQAYVIAQWWEMEKIRKNTRKLLSTAIALSMIVGIIFPSYYTVVSAYADSDEIAHKQSSAQNQLLASNNTQEENASPEETISTDADINDDLSSGTDESAPESENDSNSEIEEGLDEEEVSSSTPEEAPDESESANDSFESAEEHGEEEIEETAEEAIEDELEIDEELSAEDPDASVSLAAVTGEATVSTLAEFSAAVTAADVDTIIMEDDITITSNITIPTSKTMLTIDGQGKYTLEQSGIGTLYSNSTASASYTFKNMTVFGRSYYGLVYCTGVAGAPNIVVENVSYTGPQIIYNRYGTATFQGTNDVTIQNNGTGSDPNQEVGEVHGVVVEGELDVILSSTASSFFWMFGVGSEKPYLTIKNGARATFSTSNNMTARGFFWVDSTTLNVVMTIEDSASLLIDITGHNPLSTSNTHRIDSIYVGKKAHVTFNFGGGIALSNALVVDEDATLILNYLNEPGTSGSAGNYPLFYSLYSGAQAPIIQLRNPKQVVFAVEPSNRPIFDLQTANQLEFHGHDIEYWDSYASWASKNDPVEKWSAPEGDDTLDAMINLSSGQDVLASITSNNNDFQTNFDPKKARVIRITDKWGGLIPDESWVNVRIPTKMLFGSIDSYGNGKVISPVYEIENYSEHPVEIGLAEMKIIDDDNINLLSAANEENPGKDLKLNLDLDGTTAIEYLHPSTIAGALDNKLVTLDANAKTQLGLSGTYYGQFPTDSIYKPTYSLVWLFTPTLEGGSHGTP